MANWQQVGSVSDFPPGQVHRVGHDRCPIAVANVDGELFVFLDICPHAGFSLHDGHLEGHTIRCALHGNCYDLRTGLDADRHTAPALTTLTIRIENDALFVDTSHPKITGRWPPHDDG
jgi:nitrite reductase/ring-hydroxylating ferredoxin subunit